MGWTADMNKAPKDGRCIIAAYKGQNVSLAMAVVHWEFGNWWNVKDDEMVVALAWHPIEPMHPAMAQAILRSR